MPEKNTPIPLLGSSVSFSFSSEKCKYKLVTRNNFTARRPPIGAGQALQEFSRQYSDPACFITDFLLMAGRYSYIKIMSQYPCHVTLTLFGNTIRISRRGSRSIRTGFTILVLVAFFLPVCISRAGTASPNLWIVEVSWAAFWKYGDFIKRLLISFLFYGVFHIGL